VVGPQSMDDILLRHSLRIVRMELVDALPTFRMHQTILPQARLKATLTLFHVMQSAP
jgi:hypothetical protein